MQTHWDDQVFEGVARFAREHGLELDLTLRCTGNLPEIDDAGRTGIVAQLARGQRCAELVGFIKRSGAISVNLSRNSAYPGGPTLGPDTDAIARQVVRHFSERNFKQLTLVVYEDGQFATELERSLNIAAIGQLGFRSIKACEFSKWLPALNGPQAVLASSDFGAAKLVETCLSAGIKVPEKAAVLGVGNNELLCGSGTISISSVDTNMQSLGYLAAALLERLLRGADANTGSSLVLPKGIVTRRSTDTVCFEDANVAATLRFVRDNFQSPIQRAEIYRKLGRDAVRIDRIFRKGIGRTIIQEVTRLRVELAAKLLTEGEAAVEEIARYCGFDGRYSLERAFFRSYKNTPTAYRRKARSDDV